MFCVSRFPNSQTSMHFSCFSTSPAVFSGRLSGSEDTRSNASGLYIAVRCRVRPHQIVSSFFFLPIPSVLIHPFAATIWRALHVARHTTSRISTSLLQQAECAILSSRNYRWVLFKFSLFLKKSLDNWILLQECGESFQRHPTMEELMAEWRQENKQQTGDEQQQ